MAFSSPTSSIELKIHDGNWQQYASPDATPDGLSRGYIDRDYDEYPEGTFGQSFDIPIIPESEYQARIQYLVETKSLLSDLRKHYKIPSRNQNGTNYCWFHGPVTGVICVRMRMGLPYVDLSPASGAAVIKRGANQGGWGSAALQHIIEDGVADSTHWPHNNLRSWRELSQNPEVIANKKEHRITEWYELRPNNMPQLMTCLLHRIPVAVGYNWWGHEVCAVDPVWIDGTYAIRIWNSWGDGWSDNGMGILQGRKMSPNDAVAPRVSVAA